MTQVKCPNCNLLLEVSIHGQPIICCTCLRTHCKQFIMLEYSEEKYINLGDGFFQKAKDVK